MEALVTTLKVNKKGITIPNETGDIVVVCHVLEPWDHFKIYTQEQWKETVHGLAADNVSIERIASLAGEPIAAFLPNQPIRIDQVFLNLVAPENKADSDFVYIQDVNGISQIWDERIAPRNVSDRSVGRVRVAELSN